MNRRFVRTVIALVVAAVVVPLSPLSAADAPTHVFEELADGVYFAKGAGPIMVMSNSLVIVNESDVVVVDSHVTPAAARALIASIRGLTDKPIRFLINSHYHFDHAHGNQSLPPDVTIIGHEYARAKLSGKPLEERTFVSFMEGFDRQLAGLQERLATADGDSRSALEQQIRVLSNHIRDSDEIVPTPPNLTLRDKLTLVRGKRVIELYFLGRGHTGGDVVVFLPAERILFTGDLLLPFLSYMGDGFVDEWPQTLEKVKQLDFDVIVPGHGDPFRDRSRIDEFQSYLTDLWQRVSKMHDEGISATEAAVRVDLTTHAGVRGPGADPRAVLRIYELLDARSSP